MEFRIPPADRPGRSLPAGGHVVTSGLPTQTQAIQHTEDELEAFWSVHRHPRVGRFLVSGSISRAAPRVRLWGCTPLVVDRLRRRAFPPHEPTTLSRAV